MAERQRCFLSYRGRDLPLQLVEELPADALNHRNTWFRATYDAQDRMVCCEKLVYGEVEMRHDYTWADDGTLVQTVVALGDEEPRVLVNPGRGSSIR